MLSFHQFTLVSSQCSSIQNGGYLEKSVIVTAFDKPCNVMNDLFVPEKITLTFDPGSEIRFAPGVMLAVNGTLIAKGTPTDRVTLTKLNATNIEPSWPASIRLVDEFSVSLGRLQLNYKDKWRGICSNNVNWTQTDTDVACRQLGFETGNFSFGTWSRNDTYYMLYYSPSCLGNESSVLDCPNAKNVKIGRNICRGQQSIYLRCFGTNNLVPGSDYWWGLEFYNTTYIPVSIGNVETNESTSVLRNLDILYAGMTRTMQRVPAIRADPTAPQLVNVSIRHSALDAVNFTNLLSPVLLRNVLLYNSRGHGINIETLLGRVNITNSNFIGNQGDGLKVKFLDRRFQIYDKDLTFCSQPNVPNRYPQIITGIPGTGSECGRRFTTTYGQRLTFNILEMDIEPAAGGRIDVYDGYDDKALKIGSYSIVNGSFPMGVTTTFYYMYVKFSWTLPMYSLCPSLKFCVKFTMIIDTASESNPELYLNNTVSSNNGQYGLFIENVRNYVIINSSSVMNNGYGAGVRIFGGAGDVLINSSTIEHNRDSGVNITYDGGWRIFNRSSFSNNYGPGINITFNETSVDNYTRYTRIQQTHVSRSSFVGNQGYGLQVGNYCIAGHSVIVNDSYFSSNLFAAVQLFACFRNIPFANVSNFTIAYNKFDSNKEHAIKISPIVNVVGRISNNTFTNHRKYVLLLDNTDDFLHNQFFLPLKTFYEVWGNQFSNNYGHYIARFRLTQSSITQYMTVMYNLFIGNSLFSSTVDSSMNNVKSFSSGSDKENSVSLLNGRSRVSAVIIVSSSNVNLSRNHLENPSSRYEIATQLNEMNIILDATRQWWSTTDYKYIITRIFDQYSRYNLARINYHPALEQPWLYTPVLTDRSIALEVDFIRGDKIGGRLNVHTSLESGKTYHVDRDVSVLLGGDLLIPAGVTLKFENCLSLSVEGYAKWEGTASVPIRFEYLGNESTWINSSVIRLIAGGGYSGDDYNDAIVLQGRLMVRADNNSRWGTVCRQDWTLIDSMVACGQMGLVADLAGWQLMPTFDDNALFNNIPIYRSSVKCDTFDTWILDCNADGEDDHSCDHTMDVYLKCIQPAWGGIRFLGTSIPSVLENVFISGAGLDDPISDNTVPALKIDYNLHSLNYLTVEKNRGDGIDVYRNDILANSKLRNSVVRLNGGNGVSTRSSFFELNNCLVAGNVVAGFDYNPSSMTEEALLFRAGVTRPYQIFNFLSNGSVQLGYEEDLRWILTPRYTFGGRTMLEVEIMSKNNYKTVLDIIDYNPLTSEEEVRIYDGPRTSIRPSTTFWSLSDNLIDFPLVSQFNSLTIRWFVTNTSSGRLTFITRSKHFEKPWPFPVLTIVNSTFDSNNRAIVTRQYNQPYNEFNDLFIRYRWTKIYIRDSVFISNKFESIYAPSISRYNMLYVPDYTELEKTTQVAEINYQISDCTFKRNGLGIVSEHLNVEYSTNAWIWQLDRCVFDSNVGGGVSLYLPRVNLLDIDLYNHSVYVNGSLFANNNNFEFRLDGFYCNSTISSNKFNNNRCKIGCLSYSGTEKDFELVDNQFTNNAVGRFVIETNMNSHTPFTQWVDARISHNLVQRNKRLNPSRVGTISSPLTYAIALLGVQNVTVNRNLFGFNDLDAEMLAGQASSVLENYLDATYNYWGTNDEIEIRKKIFDFDDWNSFSMAEYHPFLIGNFFESSAYTGPKYRPILDLTKPLGGRLMENLLLKKRSTPYLVTSDLTVMPGVSLAIEAGVTLLFYPNIGILSLGSLSIIGSETDRITFAPVTLDKNDTSSYNPPWDNTDTTVSMINHPNIDPLVGYQIRLRGGRKDEDEGFLEVYNNTEKRWSIVCDDSFNERTAEVFCRSMKLESSNPAVIRSPYYDMFVLGYPKMHEQLIEWFWRETLICDGREMGVEDCKRRINYALPDCMNARRYVFIRCGPRNLPTQYNYWGSIRFNLPNYESNKMTTDFVDMQYVDIYGAGNLHDRRSAAVEGIFRTPDTDQVRIENCLWNGIDYVAPLGRFAISRNVIQNNNGYGIGVIALNGQSTDNIESSFVPLTINRVPYDAYGFIRMCTVEKLLKVTDRSLLYFKYDFETVDCVKILRSRQPRKTIGVRFLQVNLFNDTLYDNAIEMYNSEFIEESLLIGRIQPNSTLWDIKRFYTSGDLYDTITIRIKASPGYREYGFVAEIVTIPISGLWRTDFGLNQLQLITNNLLSHNEAGAYFFQNVGENNMRMNFESNFITRCGLRLINYTMPGVVDIYIQNTKLMTVSNNYIHDNAGGLFINTTTRDNQVAIYANITNNVITSNTHCYLLYIQGHRFQGFDVRYNYIAYNDVDYRNIISAFGVQLNFTDNIVYNNTGQCIMNASVEELVSISQRYERNAIYNNWASSFNRSTFFLKSAQFRISDNYLLNPYNVYEIVMFNRTKYMNDEKGLYPSVNALNNWWGKGERAYVAGRVWDRRDDDNLIQVDFDPYYKDNSSVLEGKCYPGWKLFDNKCYWYFGGVTTYQVADRICRNNRARLAWARDPTGREVGLGEMISRFQFNYNVYWRTWVYSDISKQLTANSDISKCPSLQNYVVRYVGCNELMSFICEKTPFIKPRMNPVPVILAAVFALCILLFVILPIIICAILKSSQRKEVKVERRETLRRSFRSSSKTPLSNDFEGQTPSSELTRDPFTITRNQFLNISGITIGDSSTDIPTKPNYFPPSVSSKSDIKIKGTSLNGSTVNFKQMDASDLLQSDIDSDANNIKVGRSNRGFIENEITNTVSPSYRYDDYRIAGATNEPVGYSNFNNNRRSSLKNRNYRNSRLDQRISIPPPYKEEASWRDGGGDVGGGEGFGGAPDMGLSWLNAPTSLNYVEVFNPQNPEHRQQMLQQQQQRRKHLLKRYNNQQQQQPHLHQQLSSTTTTDSLPVKTPYNQNTNNNITITNNNNNADINNIKSTTTTSPSVHFSNPQKQQQQQQLQQQLPTSSMSLSSPYKLNNNNNNSDDSNNNNTNNTNNNNLTFGDKKRKQPRPPLSATFI